MYGKGGDLLYRWGNPQAYNRGTVADRKLYLQHNPTWIPQGYSEGGKIMIFNNGNGRPGGNASSVDIISPPVDSLGNYTIALGQPYAPTSLDWTYMAPVPSDFYAQSMGSAQRLSNGNTLIDEATTGRFFEIDSSGNMVWEYINPVSLTGPIPQGTTSTSTEVFRSTFYVDNYPGIAANTLSRGVPIELNPNPSNCSLATSIIDIDKTEVVSVFPNPFYNQFKAEVSGNGSTTIILRDFLSRNILQQSFIHSVTINTEALASGIYIYELHNTNGAIANGKLLKQ